MENTRELDVFKDTKPLMVAAIYAAVACFMFLLIPLLPFIETVDENVNLFKALFVVIEGLQEMSDLEPFQMFLLLFAGCWYIFAFLVFTILFIIFAVPLIINIKKLKQFAVFGTDKIYLTALFVLLSVFVGEFFFSLLLNMMYSDSDAMIGAIAYVPNVYVVLYGAFAVIGLAVNFVCKNLIQPMRVKKENALYYGVKIALFAILMFVAAFSYVMYVSDGADGVPLTIYSSSEMTSVFVKDSGFILVNFPAIVRLLALADGGALFEDLVILIVAADVIFIFYMLLIVAAKFFHFNSNETVEYILKEGQNAEMQFFYKQKKVEPIKDDSGLILMILGGATLVFHIGLYPIARLINDIEGIEFSIAPVLSMLMLLFGAGIFFGTKYFNKYFCKKTENSEVLTFEQNKTANISASLKDGSKADVIQSETAVSAANINNAENESLTQKVSNDFDKIEDEILDEDKTSFFCDF